MAVVQEPALHSFFIFSYPECFFFNTFLTQKQLQHKR